jgi:hypothetical protein
MSRPRKLALLSIVLLIAIAAGVFVYQQKTPPKTVLLLPQGDVVLYLNFAPAPFVNLAHIFGWKELPQSIVPWQYPEFTERTNFHVDRDLDEIAISLSRGEKVEGSILLKGRFDQDRLEKYFQELASTSRSYGGKNIFPITQYQKSSSVSVLDSRTIGVTDTEPLMRALIDNFRESPRGRPVQPLIRDYFGHVPFGSAAWVIGRLPETALQQPGQDAKMNSFADTISVISLRYMLSLRFKAEFNSADEAHAIHLQQEINDLLAPLQKGVEDTNDPLSVIVNNTRIKRNGLQTVITVTVPTAVFRKLGRSNE